MEYSKIQVKKGVNLHIIKTPKFKTNLISIFLSLPLTKENVTKEALISAILRRGSNNFKTAKEMSIHLEEMYGATFDCGIEKMGNTHVLKFYIETINDEFLPERDNVLEKSIEMLCDIVFNPYIENDVFDDEYVETEKVNLKQIIESKIDNKAKYALERCVEEMYKDKPYGLYKYGYADEIDALNNKELYDTYKQIIKNAKIDLFVSGKVEIEYVKNIVSKNEQIELLEERCTNFNNNEDVFENENIKEIKEELDVTQGKLVMGLTINKENSNHKNNQDDRYIALVYNTILGGGANSKLFQNVREKASLAYTAGSNYVRQKNNIFIRCGIETKNYKKAVDIINKQLEDMKNGNFTDEELNNAKTTIIATIDFIPDEQDTGVSYYFGQELVNEVVTPDEYKEKISKITKEQVIDIAKAVKLNTVYFLKGKEE